MDVLYKGASLLLTQLSAVARCLLLLPAVLLNAVQQPARPREPGETYYAGKVLHARRRPVHNSFEYQVKMVLIDLQQPPAWFLQQQAADHMTADTARAFAKTDGRVLLLTNRVVAGYTQNPISVYYCYDAAGKLQQGIAEVTNTPWGERVTFLFRPAGDVSPKALHVSPFMDMDNSWHLKASDPSSGPQLSVSVLVTHPTLGSYFDAHLLLDRCPPEKQCPAEAGDLASLVRFGFMPQRVALWIYWQALRLAAKGVRMQPKPDESFQARVAAATGVQPSGTSGQPYTWRRALVWPWYL